MDVSRLGLFLLLNWISLCFSLQLVNISERVESLVMGETFFGPQELLDSSIADMEVFKRMFTLPKESQTSKYVAGNRTTICDKMSNVSDNVDTLVTNIKTGGRKFLPGILYLNCFNSTISELWIFIEGPVGDIFDIELDCEWQSLKVVHIINNTPQIWNLYVCDSHFKRVQVLHLYNIYFDMWKFDVALENLIISSMSLYNLVALAITYPYPINASMADSVNNNFTYPLQYLSLTGDLLSLPRYLASDFPDLKALFISHTFHENLNYYTFYADTILLHPSLELLVLNFSVIKWIKTSFFSTIFGNLENIRHCSYPTIIEFLKIPGKQCAFLQCLLGSNFECNGMHFTGNTTSRKITIAVSPKLQEFYCTGLSYAKFSPFEFVATTGIFILDSYWQTEGTCITEISSNSLVKVVYSQMSLDIFEGITETWVLSVLSVSCTSYASFKRIGFSNMEILNLNNVQIDNREDLWGIFYKSARHKLKSVELRNNHLPSLAGLQICLNQQNLQSVDLSFNEIDEIPMYFLQGCVNLNYLSLSHNKLGVKEIPMHFLQACNMLKYLNLSHNQIHVLPTATHKDIERLEIKVDLSFNPLNCDCHPDSIKTLSHLHANSHKYEAFHEYVCFGHGKYFRVSNLDFEVHFDPCDKWTIPEIIGLCIGSSAGSMLFGIFIWLSIKYRYRIVKCLFNARRKLLCKSAEHQNFPFDLYLVYDRDDRCFVHNIFIKAMEDISGFKCCVPFRDFPGEGIQSELIYRYMDASRYVVVMLSRASINKYWTSFEIERAQDLERRQGKTIFYVKLDKLGRDVTHEVKKVLDSGNFTEWPKDFRNDNKGAQFFHKLIEEIHDEELCDICCTCSIPSSRLMPLDDQSVEMQMNENAPDPFGSTT